MNGKRKVDRKKEGRRGGGGGGGGNGRKKLEDKTRWGKKEMQVEGKRKGRKEKE